MDKKNMLVFVSMVILTIILIVTVLDTENKAGYEADYNAKVDGIMADTVEIEKKFLIDKNNIPYDLKDAYKIDIAQTYINFSPEIRVRRIDNGREYTFAVKTQLTKDGLTRNEIEENITKEEYENMITKKEGNTIYKTRYQFLDGDYLIAIDIFSGELEGLAYMEIEFENHEIANQYRTPDWVIKDVTDDVNYKNGYLARYGIPDSYYKYIKK